MGKTWSCAARRMGFRVSEKRGFLQKIRKSKTANVLPIVAAGLVPMLAMIGGAVDMSRAYMVRSRIQQACDAGVLAGRRAMDTGTYTTAAQGAADDFFAVNFPGGYQGTTDLNFTTTNPQGSSKVEGSATVDVPTVIMGMFGKPVIPVAVTCEAELNVSNSDITFVLDVTGSMDSNISNGAGGTTTRIQALRDAVMSFYDVLASASVGSEARVRYGFVPYSQTVNVGELIYDQNPEYLQGGQLTDSHLYQSRKPWWKHTVTTPSGPPVVTNETYQVNLPASNCNKYGDNVNFNQSGGNNFRPSPQGSMVTTTTSITEYERLSWGGASPGFSGSGNKTCVRKVTVTPIVTTVTIVDVYSPGDTLDHYEYLQRNYETYNFVRSIKSGNPSVLLPSEASASYDRWNGCIEERLTTPAPNFSYVSGSGIVASDGGDAADLDIDRVPNTYETKWAPYWDKVYWRRNASRSTTCVVKAQLLAERTRDDVQTFVDSLAANGNTYHDIGLIWGARLASPDGIFRDNVIEPPGNSGSVTRHIIFMTDGELSVTSTGFGTYGVEELDKRIANGSNSPGQQERHRRRFLAMCQAIKGKGIRLWVVAFSTSLSADMTACASSGSAFQSTNGAALQDNFRNIAEQISELRLTN